MLPSSSFLRPSEALGKSRTVPSQSVTRLTFPVIFSAFSGVFSWSHQKSSAALDAAELKSGFAVARSWG